MERNRALGKTEPPSHGGDLARARRLHGGEAADWLDLSTGINAVPYPLTLAAPASPVWTRLPEDHATAAAAEAARRAYGAAPKAAVTPIAGAGAAIGALPRLLRPAAEASSARVAILGPTYAEHAAAFAADGWRVDEVGALEQAEGADVAVVVNPNNPDGRRFGREALLSLRERVGRLIVDESFIDETPDSSLAGACGIEGLIVLRSLGKFYGLAGLRLGFAITGPALAAALRRLLGPWPVSGPALHFGAQALGDAVWAEETRRRLLHTGPRLRALGEAARLAPIGGTGLFQSFGAPDASALQTALAGRRIWTRIWRERPGWIRFGAPGPEADWARLSRALDAVAP